MEESAALGCFTGDLLSALSGFGLCGLVPSPAVLHDNAYAELVFDDECGDYKFSWYTVT